MLKPNDIIVPEFSKVITGGYKPGEVKAFIDQLVADYGELYESFSKREKELKETALKLKDISEQYYELSRTASMTPDAIGTEIIDSATTEAGKIIEDANARASEIFTTNVEKTKTVCNEVLAKYIEAFEAEKQKFIALHGAYIEFVSRITEACNTQSEVLASNLIKFDVEAVKAIDFKSDIRAVLAKKNDEVQE